MKSFVVKLNIGMKRVDSSCKRFILLKAICRSSVLCSSTWSTKNILETTNLKCIQRDILKEPLRAKLFQTHQICKLRRLDTLARETTVQNIWASCFKESRFYQENCEYINLIIAKSVHVLCILPI